MSNTDININIIDRIKEIFILYIIILYHYKILDIDKIIDIIFGFYKINFNIIDNRVFFIKINNYLLTNNNENNDFFKLSKYMTFIHVISKINEDIIQFIKLINNCKVYKSQNRQIKLDDYDILNGDLYHNNTIFTCLKDEIEFIKKYIESYEFFGKKNNFFTFGFIDAKTEDQETHKIEIINRIIMIKKKLGEKLLYFILYKKDRKKTQKMDYIDIYEDDYLYKLKYMEILQYSYKLFNELNDILTSYLKDFEFCKYLKAIIISFINDHKDKITQKLHEKLIKKYVILE
jgi:hypothetical protein